jgi:membrane-associated phospholipid phosphatase
VDVFPSLHCANSLYILLSDYEHKRWRFWAYLVPCVGLWASTLYLRYHYFIDVLCGLVLGWLAWMMANRMGRQGAT